MDHVNWSDDETQMTKDEATEVAAIYDELKDQEIELEIPEFGDYSKNFYVEMENDDGIAQSFDNMVYVVNLDPNTMTISTTIVPEGKITYGGDWFFYYGNGEYGIWPTKDLLKENTGIEFDEQGNVILPPDSKLIIDDYGTVNQVYTAKDGTQQRLMVYGNFTGKYYEDKTVPEGPTVPTAAPTTAAPTAKPDATSATGTTKGSSTNPSANGANGAVATGDFSFAVVLFVVVIGAAGVFYFSRKKYNK